jgi:hypothetical protein
MTINTSSPGPSTGTGCGYFNGSAYCKPPNLDLTLYGVSGLTFCMWVNSTTAAGWARVLAFYFVDATKGLLLTVNYTNPIGLRAILFDRRFTGSAGQIYGYMGWSDANIFNQSVWVHVALTISANAINPICTIYVNGISKTVSNNGPTNYPVITNYDLYSIIGESYTGYIDDLRVYTSCLSATQISSIVSKTI